LDFFIINNFDFVLGILQTFAKIRVHVTAIRPPTVPPNSCRFLCTLPLPLLPKKKEKKEKKELAICRWHSSLIGWLTDWLLYSVSCGYFVQVYFDLRIRIRDY